MSKLEHQFTAWLDGELPPAARAGFEQKLRAAGLDPGFATDWELIRTFLRHAEEVRPMPHRDFFRSEVMRQIHAADGGTRIPAGRAGRARRLAWLGAGLGAACALLTLLWAPMIFEHRGPAATTEVLFLESKQPGVEAYVVKGRKTNSTVVWLQGLPPRPAAN